MRRIVFALALLAAPAPSFAARAATWEALADCAAAYAANAALADPGRAASMTASISELADDYAAAAVRRLAARSQGGEGEAAAEVRSRMAEQRAQFAARPRAEVERFIEACPQPDE